MGRVNVKKMATLGDSSPDTTSEYYRKQKSYDYRKDPKYIAERWWRRFFALMSSGFFVCVGIVLAYHYTDGFASLTPSKPSDPLAEVPVYSDAELNDKLKTASCAEDKDFLFNLLQGEEDSAVGISTDVTIHNVAATIDVAFDVPVVEIFRLEWTGTESQQ